MSMISWLFSSNKRPRHALTAPANSGNSRKAGQREGSASGGSARRKAERAGRRELLYAVVREAMVRAGVLSSSYKFKVLSLDSDGRQFLIMIDMVHGGGADPASLAEMEALIAQSAKSRHEILVSAVYWRWHEHIAVGHNDPKRPRAGDSQPMPLDSQPAPLHQAPDPLVASSRGPAYEPIQADEVEAFKKALVAGSRPAALAPTPKAASSGADDGHAAHGPRSYTLLTGYEDTELPDSNQKAPILSGTQYGDLR